ncbi:uncharacterized protein [Nicotiana sylvestris]|uniref:uncharacterized protein n=1 Tax=Nicotiana sylvestris TaxID=4096 RepID=UPI00388CC2AF
MLGRIKQWTAKFLSYAGRLQLIKSVLFAIQSFWSQIFPLPKKIIRGIDTICKRFLWTGETKNKAKALVVWKQLCWPKSAGGLNITDILIWNRAALIKHIWNIDKKKDRVWIQWIYTYYFKQQVVWNVKVKQAVWLTQKILCATKYLNEASIGIKEVMNMQEYSIRLVYDKLRGELPKVEWKRLVCNNIRNPKWIFNLYLAILGRLYMRDILLGWGIAICSDCSLCGRATESHDHLFFKCNYSTVIWRKLLQWLGITRDVHGWNDEIQWTVRHAAGKKQIYVIYRMLLACVVYYIWQERNWRTFRGTQRSCEELIRMIVQEVHCRGNLNFKVARKLQEFNFYR